MSTPKVISIGAGVQDVFLQGKIFAAHHEKHDLVQEFKLGTKNEIEEITISTGGGATNAAVTFARQGINSCFLGRVGDDVSGKSVLSDLHKEDVDTSLVLHDEKYGTGYSTILLAPSGERTILTYRGASQHLELHERDFHNIRADWFYVSSLSGDTASLKVLIDYAQEHDIKIAINPGKGELEHIKQIKELLQKFTVLSLNLEEMRELFGNKSPRELLQHATSQVPLVLLTDGPNGSYASDGTHFFKAGMYEDVKVVDRAGAGDAFSSGFVSQIVRGESIERAMTFASANSTSVVAQIGAKAGILHENIKLHHMLVEVSNL
jgi:ribokinase